MKSRRESKSEKRMCLPILQVVALPMVVLLAIVIGISFFSKSILTKVKTSRDVSSKFAMLAQNMKFDVIQVQQWLTDISATRALNGLDDGFEEAAASKASFLQGLNQFRSLFESNGNNDQLEMLRNIQSEFDDYYEVGLVMAKEYVKHGPEGGNAHMADFDRAAEKLATDLERFVANQREALEQNLSDTQILTARFNRNIQIAGVVTLSLWLLFMYGFVKKVIIPLKTVASTLSGAAAQLASTSAQVSSSSQSLAEGSSEQAASLEETSAALEEMTSMLKRTEEAVRQAKILSNQTSSAAASGSSDMSEMKKAMGQIQASSADVAQIVKDIDEIAFQTNILALNAAVEAARAGEAGMGFAVVADEVRNLALRSAKSAKETASKIEESISRSEHGVTISNKVAESFALIAERTVEVDRFVSEIATASQEQSQGVHQVNIAITQMNEVTQSNAANSEESASAAEDLNTQAETIKKSVQALQELAGVGKVEIHHLPESGRRSTSKMPALTQFSPSRIPLVAKTENHNRNGASLAKWGNNEISTSLPLETSRHLNGNTRNGNTDHGETFMGF